MEIVERIAIGRSLLDHRGLEYCEYAAPKSCDLDTNPSGPYNLWRTVYGLTFSGLRKRTVEGNL
jgi:hypothetical protein